MQLISHIARTLSVASLTVLTSGLLAFSQTTIAAAGEERILHEQQIVTAGDNTPELVQDLQDALGELGPDYEARTVHWVDEDKPAFLNRLILEDSPYLIQHAHNPVNWYPWGQEAFDKAAAEDKPIFLSIGYATCHWCHVMERESFESKEIADYLNEHFVTIKVDREQRPDVDASYMSAVQIMTGSGGWPMSSFLTTDTKPFYGGTYYPPDVFTDLLKQIVGVWDQGRDSIEAQAEELSAAVVTSSQLAGEAMEVGSLVIDKAVADIVSSYDDMQGGFGGAPKFPQESKLFLLLDYARRTGNEAALEAAHYSLQRMAAGGIHDQVAGGFHRYTVDNDWLIPHFEKMLYNQALLARNYLTAYTVNGDPEHRRTLTRLLDYVLREMLAPEGGFYSATDADSEGEEGTFFIWTPEELSSVLNDEELNFAEAFWNVTERGNFEHSNILHSTGSLLDEAGEFDMPYDEFVKRVDAISAKLLAARQSREKPLRDDKLITAWNGMMITALAEAGDLLEIQKYTDSALTAANFVWENSRSSGGQLWRAYYNGSASVEAAQEDYAYLAESFIRLYDSTGDGKWLTRAETLAATMHDTFWDNEGGGYFLGTEIVGAVRPKNLYDTSIPSGNAVALGVLTRLWHRTGKDLYKQRADAQVVAFSNFLQSFPSAFAYMLKSTSELLSGESGHRFFAARGNVKIDARKHEDEVRVEIAMSEGWHLNSNKPNQDYLIPTRLMSEDGKDLSSTEYPDSITKILSFSTGEELALYEDKVVITTALADVKTINNTQLIPLTLQLQACDDTVCLPPETVSFSLTLAQ